MEMNTIDLYSLVILWTVWVVGIYYYFGALLALVFIMCIILSKKSIIATLKAKNKMEG